MVRPRQKRSIVWEFFEKSDTDKVRCTKCNTVFKFCKNTSNLLDHIKRKHDLAMREILNNRAEGPPDDESTHTPSTSTTTGNKSTSDCQLTLHPPPSKKIRQLRLTTKSEDVITVDKMKLFDCNIAKMIALDFQPLSMVEDEGFKILIQSLRPEYTLPSRKTLSDKILPELYNDIKCKIIKMLEEIEYISITTDLWTSSSNKSYITVTGHFIHNFEFYSVVLATKEVKTTHTGENIGEAITNILETFHVLHKVVTIVTDNGSNMKKAVSDYLKKYNHYCVAHTLNLCVQDAVNANKEFLTIVSKCKAIVSYFKRSSIAAYKLREIQLQMNLPVLVLIQDVSTRWNSGVNDATTTCRVEGPCSCSISIIN